MGWKEQVDRGIELLAHCQKLQSEKDGIDRPDLWVMDKSKVLDDFAMDISNAAMNMSALYKLYPMLEKLTKIGKQLHEKGLIDVDYGDDFSLKAIDYLEQQCITERI